VLVFAGEIGPARAAGRWHGCCKRLPAEADGNGGKLVEACRARTRETLEGAEAIQASLVELVVAVSECTEDEGEIRDRLDGLLASGRVQLEALA